MSAPADEKKPKAASSPADTKQKVKKTIEKPVLTKAQQEAEMKRREMQKAKQAEALALRAQGLEFKSTAKKRKPLERRRELKRKAERHSERNSARRSAQKAAKVAKATAPDVVVVPIFWKGQAGQMGSVLSICSDAEAALKAAGWNVQLDAGHKYTPGQKYAHWEHRGVRLRLEVGPQEASRGNCTVALTRAPGVPAERVNGVAVNAESLPRKLAEYRAQLGDAAVAAAPSAGASVAAAQGAGGDAARKPEEEQPTAAVLIGDGVLALRRPVAHAGGDDLDDDFGDLGRAGGDEGEGAAEEGGKKKKKKRSLTEDAEVGSGDVVAAKAKKKAKTVTF